jgi:hypothetical protein
MTARLVPFACVFAVVLAAALPWHVRSAQACSCAYLPNESPLRFVDTVFAGTAVEVEEWDMNGSSAEPVAIKFAVDHVWLGTVSSEVEVTTAAAGVSCGYTFEKDVRYLVYARGNEVSLCSATQPFDSGAVEELEAVTGPGATVAPSPNQPRTNDSLAEPESAGGAWGFARVGIVVLAAAGVVSVLGARRAPNGRR